MRVDLDAKVLTRDGDEVGTLQLAIVDPRTNEVTHFVVSTGVIFDRAIELPREEIERADHDGDVVRLRLSKAELEALPGHTPEGYDQPPPEWTPPAAYAYPLGAYRWPAPTPAMVADPTLPAGQPITPPLPAQGAPGSMLGSGMSGPAATAAESAQTAAGDAPDAVDAQAEIGIGKGAMVVAAGGDEIGVVDDLLLDESSGQLRGFVLRLGGMLQTLFGGGDTVEVPAEHVARIDESTVYLGVAKDELIQPGR
jgi:sporulation protein YlmC with PRC-barrel domain